MFFVITLAFLVALSCGLPRDVVIRFERRVSRNGTVEERIYLKGQSAEHSVVRSIQDDALMNMWKHATSNNGTYMRLRECKLRGNQVFELSDRFEMNGKDYLALDPDDDAWTVLVPEARDVKKMWALATAEKSHLKEDCEEFLKQMDDNGNQKERGVLRVIAPVLTTFIFVGFVFTSILIFKRQGQHPGGVIGSIIHYPAHHLEVPIAGQRTALT